MIPPGIFVNALILATFAEFPQVAHARPNPHSATTIVKIRRDLQELCSGRPDTREGWMRFRRPEMAENHHARCNPAILVQVEPFVCR
jgi:hypothetical protein